jgi:hypothetical protein
MWSFRGNKEDIEAALAARHIEEADRQATAGKQSAIARGPRQRLRQLRRRHEAAQRDESDVYLNQRWERLRPT